MSNDTENFPMETDPANAFEEAVRLIKKCWAKQNGAVLDTAKQIVESLKQFQDKQQVLAERTGFTPSKFSKLIKVGKTSEFYEERFQHLLPAGSALLYELSLVPNLGAMLESNIVGPDMSRDQIITLRKKEENRINTVGELLAIVDAPEHVPLKSKKSVAKPKLPDGICAMIENPKKASQVQAIETALGWLKKAGVMTIDVWTEGQSKEDKAWKQRETLITKMAEKVVKKRVNQVRRQYKKRGKLEEFHRTYGKREDIDISGDRERARELYGQFENAELYDDLIRDLEMTVPMVGVDLNYPQVENDSVEETTMPVVSDSPSVNEMGPTNKFDFDYSPR